MICRKDVLNYMPIQSSLGGLAKVHLTPEDVQKFKLKNLDLVAILVAATLVILPRLYGISVRIIAGE